MPGFPKAARCMACSHGGCVHASQLIGSVSSGTLRGPPAQRSLLWGRGFCSNRQTPATAAAAAWQGRGATKGGPKSSLPVNPPDELSDDVLSRGSTQQESQQQEQQQRRRHFGPEPPPRSLPSGAASSAARSETTSLPLPTVSAETAPVAAAAPKRRGRPPKLRAPSQADDATGPPSPQQQPTMPTMPPPSKTVPLAEAAAAVAAAVVPESSSSSSSRARRPLGPEPPPPPPSPQLPRSDDRGAAPFPFALPKDPSQLNADDILDLPLPDPRLGEHFRLDGDLSDLAALGEAAGIGVDAADLEAVGDGNDDDSDLDYDEVIALAGRVDAASYVARAFERAKQGLEPVPDPALAHAEAEPAAAAATSVAAAATAATAATATVQLSPNASATIGAVRSHSSIAAAAAAAAVSVTPSPRQAAAAYVDDDDVNDDDDGGGAEVVDAEVAAQRRVALLVDLLSASGTELEAKLEAAAPEVDEQMLVLLERRYTAALTLRQDAAATERIATLYRVLRYMYERRTSSAAERLLDDVLGILADAELQPDAERRRGEAAARLRNAFTGGMLDVDVFTAAAALAEGRQAAVEALAGEQVSLETFKAKAMELLDHARRVQADTTASLETIEAEVDRMRSEEPGALEGREWRLRLEQMRLARQALAEREQSISALEDVLVLTRAVELQMLTGRLEG